MTLTLDYKKNRNGMCLMNDRKKKVERKWETRKIAFNGNSHDKSP